MWTLLGPSLLTGIGQPLLVDWHAWALATNSVWALERMSLKAVYL